VAGVSLLSPTGPHAIDPRAARQAVAFPDGELSYAALDRAAAEFRRALPGEGPVALWATAACSTAVALVAALRAGLHVIPLNPSSGAAELRQIISVARPSVLLAEPGTAVEGLTTISPGDATVPRSAVPAGDKDLSDAGGLIVFTSGTTGPPKGVVLGAAAIAANLDALAQAWQWSERDVIVHALPLCHVHGLVIATLGALRRGGEVRHIGAFDPATLAGALAGGATMLFAVPTMYRRLADAAASDPAIAAALRGARLLVSGSAALAAADHDRIAVLCGQRVLERYGMTETLMITSARVDGDRRAGHVGWPLEGVELRVVDDAGDDVVADGATIGDVLVRGPSLFDGYLDAADATAAAFRDGWFATGDLGALAPDGCLRLLGRRSSDLIKSGGYRIGAGEVESALAEHPAVAEAAVLGVADDDLGQRIVAWIVRRDGMEVAETELADHVARTLAPHKRPREVRFVDTLPRNLLGKVQKGLLTEAPVGTAASIPRTE
jgi:acyl-CoA synthetase (AMP-forming)/AMP-acid ligase II